jgi:hypothetical protein
VQAAKDRYRRNIAVRERSSEGPRSTPLRPFARRCVGRHHHVTRLFAAEEDWQSLSEQCFAI